MTKRTLTEVTCEQEYGDRAWTAIADFMWNQRKWMERWAGYVGRFVWAAAVTVVAIVCVIPLAASVGIQKFARTILFGHQVRAGIIRDCDGIYYRVGGSTCST